MPDPAPIAPDRDQPVDQGHRAVALQPAVDHLEIDEDVVDALDENVGADDRGGVPGLENDVGLAVLLLEHRRPVDVLHIKNPPSVDPISAKDEGSGVGAGPQTPMA